MKDSIYNLFIASLSNNVVIICGRLERTGQVWLPGKTGPDLPQCLDLDEPTQEPCHKRLSLQGTACVLYTVDPSKQFLLRAVEHLS